MPALVIDVTTVILLQILAWVPLILWLPHVPWLLWLLWLPEFWRFLGC